MVCRQLSQELVWKTSWGIGTLPQWKELLLSIQESWIWTQDYNRAACPWARHFNISGPSFPYLVNENTKLCLPEGGEAQARWSVLVFGTREWHINNSSLRKLEELSFKPSYFATNVFLWQHWSVPPLAVANHKQSFGARQGLSLTVRQQGLPTGSWPAYQWILNQAKRGCSAHAVTAQLLAHIISRPLLCTSTLRLEVGT